MWDELARQLAAAGMNALTVDNRGHGESGVRYDAWSDPDRKQARDKWANDLDIAFLFLVSQPEAAHDVIGLGGAGVLGVNNAAETARRHPEQIKSLALPSGETFRDGLQFLRDASQLPGLFVVADDDEYPPTVEAMESWALTKCVPVTSRLRSIF